ncbi:MAG: hypothetical protein EOO05_20590 [Chitinophagaceae bacterium]|nr:MAG: hypothetical protein EOO05_20590 [Chitinophagaceae bacterium]
MKMYQQLLLAFVLAIKTNAQESTPPVTIQAGLLSGGMNCFTDLGGQASSSGLAAIDLRLADTRPVAGMYGLLSWKHRISLQPSVMTGSVAAADHSLGDKADDPGGRYIRNLSFRSHISEVRLLVEGGVFNKWWYGEEGIHRLTVGVCAGVSLFHFNPVTKMDGALYKLRDFHLEGQGFDEFPSRSVYRRTQLSIPVGFVVRRLLTSRFCFAAEFSYRFLFTDYLDDVSETYIDPALFSKYLATEPARIARMLQFRTPELVNATFPLHQPRGNAAKKDAWFSFGLKAGVSL